MEYWFINDDFKPQWVKDLIDRKLLIHKPNHLSNCYLFKNTFTTASPTYLFDGDGLCFEDNTIGVIFNLYYHNFKELKENIEVIKYYCDMCGKEIFDESDIYKVSIHKSDDSFYLDELRKDICEDCFNKIRDMMKRRTKDEL